MEKPTIDTVRGTCARCGRKGSTFEGLVTIPGGKEEYCFQTLFPSLIVGIFTCGTGLCNTTGIPVVDPDEQFHRKGAPTFKDWRKFK